MESRIRETGHGLACLDYSATEIERLIQEHALMVEALVFYADNENWWTPHEINLKPGEPGWGYAEWALDQIDENLLSNRGINE